MLQRRQYDITLFYYDITLSVLFSVLHTPSCSVSILLYRLEKQNKTVLNDNDFLMNSTIRITEHRLYETL